MRSDHSLELGPGSMPDFYSIKFDKIRTAFLVFYLALFLVTAVSKVVSITLEGSYGKYADPIFPFLQLETTGMMAAGIEILACGLILRSLLFSYFYKRITLIGDLAIACVCALFSIYRLGLWLVAYKKPCGCIGFINQLAQSEVQLLNNLLWVALVTGILGGITCCKKITELKFTKV